MTSCCNFESCNENIMKVLWFVLIINSVVFSGQFLFAIIAHSSSLFADSIDMIGDVIAYSVSLYALKHGGQWFNKAALLKGIIICLLAFAVFLDASNKIWHDESIPFYNYMMLFSALGLATNGICLWLLTSYKYENLNMQSIWICSRNDILVNMSVILTSLLVFYFQSKWPDVIIGILLSLFIFYSGLKIITWSVTEMRNGINFKIKIFNFNYRLKLEPRSSVAR